MFKRKSKLKIRKQKSQKSIPYEQQIIKVNRKRQKKSQKVPNKYKQTKNQHKSNAKQTITGNQVV